MMHLVFFSVSIMTVMVKGKSKAHLNDSLMKFSVQIKFKAVADILERKMFPLKVKGDWRLKKKKKKHKLDVHFSLVQAGP